MNSKIALSYSIREYLKIPVTLLCMLLVSVGLAQPSHATTITYVQSSKTIATNTNSNTVTLNSVGAGNLLVLVISCTDSTSGADTVSDGINTWTLIGTKLGPYASSDNLDMFYAQNVAAGNTTVTVTTPGSGSGQQVSLALSEYSGVATTNALDQTAGTHGSGSSANSGSTSATDTANELLVCGLDTDSGSSSATVNAGTSYTLRQSNTSGSGHEVMGIEDRIVSATGTYNGTFTVGSGDSWGARVATFREANATVSPTTGSCTLGTATDQSYTVILNGKTLSSVMNGATTLTSGTDYTWASPTLTLKAAYLNNTNAHQVAVGSNTLTLNMSGGTAPTITETVNAGNSTISPASNSCTLGTATDQSYTVTLNGNTLSSLTNGATTLTSGTDYTWDGTSTLVLRANYLNTLPPGSQTITLNMSGGTNPTITITILASVNVKKDDQTRAYIITPASNNSPVAIPCSVVLAAEHDGYALVVDHPIARVVIPAAVVQHDLAMNATEQLSLSIERLQNTALVNMLQNTDPHIVALGNLCTFEMNVLNGGTTPVHPVTTFSLPLKIVIKNVTGYAVPTKTSVYNVVSAYDATGMLTSVASIYAGGKLDTNTHEMTFYTDHFSLYIIMERSMTFSDISGSWARDAIEVLASRSIIAGNGGLFYPTANVKRVDFSILMNKSLAKRPATYSVVFNDVTRANYFAGHVLSLNTYGILDVQGGTTSNPTRFGAYTDPTTTLKDMTRVQAAVFLANGYNYIKTYHSALQDGKQPTTSYPDVNSTNSSIGSSIQTVTALGIMKGYPDGTFRPDATMTRQEAAQVMYTFLLRTNSMAYFVSTSPDVG